MANNAKSVSDFFSPIEPLGDFMLTKRGTIIGAIELNGVDPDGLSDDDHFALTLIARSVYGRLIRNISISQYFVHYDGVNVELRERADVRSHLLSQRRQAYLNTKNLNTSRIIHCLEIEPDIDINNLAIMDVMKHLFLVFFNPSSLEIIKNKFFGKSAFLKDVQELTRMASLLEDSIKEVVAKWQGVCRAKQLTGHELWAFMRFLSSCDPEMLRLGLKETIPNSDLDIYVSAGNVQNVQVKYMDVLKIGGISNRYVRIAKVRNFVTNGGKIKPGVWASDDKAPVRLKGNFVLMTRWKPLTEMQRTWMFMKKKTELERSKLSVFELLKGGEDRSELERQASLSPALKKKMEELGSVESIPDLIGTGESYMVAFSESPEELRKMSLELTRASSNVGINMFWENVNIDEAFTAFQIGQRKANPDVLNMRSTQFAAVCLIHQSSEGQMVVPDLSNEEPQYMLTSKDGQLFGYSPFIGGRAMVIGVGPIRSGKTFAKNTMGMHFLKYGGFYRAIDIDPGSELIAASFQGDKGVFKVSSDGKHGFNPFSSYKGRDDMTFRAHFNSLLLEMLQANDAATDRELTPLEQANADIALEAMLDEDLPKELKTLSHFVGHLDENLARKFKRWVRSRNASSSENGRYAHLFDVVDDSVGDLQTMIGVFNVQALRDDKRALRPVLLEIFYRITQSFEDPKYRHLPKQLDIDEAHYTLSIDQCLDYLVSKVRTWGKFFGSINMWSQSAQEFADIKNWAAVRSAATTFWFMSDPNMDKALYKSTFGLSDGQCEAIRNLTPKKEAFLWQPEIGVSKVVLFDVEVEQAIMNTSHPRDAAMRDKLIQLHGFERGMELAVEHFKRQGFGDVDDSRVRAIA